MTLEDIKKYCRVDDDIEDDLLESLMKAATMFIEQKTGKRFSADNHIFVLAIKQLVAHWFDNRMVAASGGASELPYTITSLLTHISHCSELEAEEDG